MRNPKASSSADHDLTHLLESYDKVPNGDPVLQNLYPGERFVFRGREYQLIKHRRTRSICEERRSGRRYLVPMICKVKPVS